ncbi:MAG: serine protease [Rhodomicrobiaceae bacterium]
MFRRQIWRFSLTAILTLAVFATTAVAQGDCIDNRRIVGGVDTDIKEHPWQVALYLLATDGLCGGSLIQDRWVLTAAHCFADSAVPQSIRVKAGATNYQQGGAWTEVEKVVIHENYDASTHENDLALVRLKSATPGDTIPLAGANQPLKACDKLEVTGWGRTSEGGQVSDTLQKGEILYVENATCNAADIYDGDVKQGMMCAGFRDGGVDSCQGDSGGPLVLRGEDGPVLVGVVSWGEGCARKLRYGVYTRVNAYNDWIAKTILANEN